MRRTARASSSAASRCSSLSTTPKPVELRVGTCTCSSTASGSPMPSGRFRYGTMSNAERRTTTCRPGTSARMRSITRRMNRVRFSSDPPYGPLRVTGAEQLVTEIAVAGLDVDEREPGVAREAGGRDEIVHQPFELVVLQRRGRRPESGDRVPGACTPPAVRAGRTRRAWRSVPSASAEGRRRDPRRRSGPKRSRCAPISSSRSRASAGCVPGVINS